MISTTEIDKRIDEANNQLEGAIATSSPVAASEWAEVLHMLLLTRRIVDEDGLSDEG